jgi:hypothetical protein
MIKKFIENFFNLSKKYKELKIKNAELENKVLQNSVELQILKKSLDDNQTSLNLLVSANNNLSNEISTIYEIIKSMISPSGSTLEIYIDDLSSDNDDKNNLN